MTSQGTNTPLDKSTMTINENNQLERPNSFAVGEIGFNNLSKPEINKTGPVFCILYSVFQEVTHVHSTESRGKGPSI